MKQNPDLMRQFASAAMGSMGASPDMTSMFMGQNGNTNSTSKTSSSSRMSGSNTKTVSNENRTFTPPSGIDELLNSLESNNDSGNDNVTLDNKFSIIIHF